MFHAKVWQLCKPVKIAATTNELKVCHLAAKKLFVLVKSVL